MRIFSVSFILVCVLPKRAPRFYFPVVSFPNALIPAPLTPGLLGWQLAKTKRDRDYGGTVTLAFTLSRETVVT